MTEGVDGPGWDGEEVGPEGLYLLPPEGELDPRTIAHRLVATESDFAHLRVGEAGILFLMRAVPKEKGGKTILGQMCLPQFGGALGNVGTWLLAKVCEGVPDFVMLLDNQWWVQASPQQREALVFHEMCHAVHAVDKHGEYRFTPEGAPVWAIAPHDMEEFNAVVRRYGAWLPDVQGFIGALREGGAI